MQLPVLDTRHSHSLGVNVLVCVELSLDSIGSSGYKEISFIKIDQEGPEIWKIHPNDPRSGGFWLNLSKKVKFHLFCINLDTGYFLYVIVWIPKAFSLLTHHPRVVFTISKKLFLDGHYNLQFFTMFNLNFLSNKKTSILILTFLHPTHRFIITLREKIIHFNPLFWECHFSSLRPEKQAQGLTGKAQGQGLTPLLDTQTVHPATPH